MNKGGREGGRRIKEVEGIEEQYSEDVEKARNRRKEEC